MASILGRLAETFNKSSQIEFRVALPSGFMRTAFFHQIPIKAITRFRKSVYSSPVADTISDRR